MRWSGYQNITHRLNWGVVAQQIPYTPVLCGGTGHHQRRTGPDRSGAATAANQPGSVWVFAYPFSTVQRVNFRRDSATSASTASFVPRVLLVTGDQVVDDKQDLPAGSDLNLGSASAAWCTTTHSWALPGRSWPAYPGGSVAQHRVVVVPWRAGRLSQVLHAGPPLHIATRVMHYGRYGSGGEDRTAAAAFPWVSGPGPRLQLRFLRCLGMHGRRQTTRPHVQHSINFGQPYSRGQR